MDCHCCNCQPDEIKEETTEKITYSYPHDEKLDEEQPTFYIPPDVTSQTNKTKPPSEATTKITTPITNFRS